jgi:hypothetical protein
MVEGRPQQSLNDDELINHLSPLLDELCRRVEDMSIKLTAIAKNASVLHGDLRRRQGFSAVFLLQESTAIRQVILQVIHHNLMVLNLSYLFIDLAVMSDSLDDQLEVAMTSFLQEQQ